MKLIGIDVPDLTVVRELKLSTFDMGWMAKALLAAAATDELHGVKYHAHVVADGLSATAAATDGYRIHQLHLALRGPVAPVEAVIPHDVLVWASKNERTFKAKKDSLIEPVAVLRFEVPVAPDETSKPGWVSVIYREWDDDTAPSARFDAPLVGEEFPPLDRVVDAAREAEPGSPAPLGLTFIADARTLETPFTATPTIGYTTHATTGRPGAALLDFWEGSVLRGTALIQPQREEVE